MDKDTIKGTAKQATGATKAKAGELAGKPGLETEGHTEKAEGTMQKKFGQTKDAVRKD